MYRQSRLTGFLGGFQCLCKGLSFDHLALDLRQTLLKRGGVTLRCRARTSGVRFVHDVEPACTTTSSHSPKVNGTRMGHTQLPRIRCKDPPSSAVPQSLIGPVWWESVVLLHPSFLPQGLLHPSYLHSLLILGPEPVVREHRCQCFSCYYARQHG
jgi:hypothetical protein